jgi:hypothetical protein
MNPNAKPFVFNPHASSFTPTSLPSATNPSAHASGSAPGPAAPVIGKEGEGDKNGESAEKEEGRHDETKSMWQLPPSYSGGLPPPHQYPPQYYQV